MQRIGCPPVLVVNLECLDLSLSHFPQYSNAKAYCVVCSHHGMRHESWTECTMCIVSLCGGYTGCLWFKNYHPLRAYYSQ